MRKIIGRISNGKYFSEEPATVSRMQEMLDARKGPALGTDTEYFKGLGTADPFEGLPEAVKPYAWKKALAAGIDPRGKRYCGSVALEPCDPHALIDSVGEMRKIIENNNMTSEGIINHTAEVNAEPRSEYIPAPDIVEERTIDILDAQGAPDIVSRKEFEMAEDKAYNSLLR